MKYIRKLEEFSEQSNEPEVGDYVICHENYCISAEDEIVDFVNSNVGQILEIFNKSLLPYIIQY